MNSSEEMIELIKLLRDIDNIDSEITFSIFEEGIEELPNNEKLFEKIGRNIYELHGLEHTFFHNIVYRLAKYLESILSVKDSNDNFDIIDKLFQICMTEEDEVDDKINEFLKKVKEIDYYESKDDESRSFNWFTFNHESWREFDSSTAGYIMDKKIYHHRGVFVPKKFLKTFYKEFEKLESGKEICVKLFYKKRAYNGYLIKEDIGYLLHWDPLLRRRINKKFPEIFDYNQDEKNVADNVIMTFNTHENYDKDFIKIDFVRL